MDSLISAERDRESLRAVELPKLPSEKDPYGFGRPKYESEEAKQKSFSDYKIHLEKVRVESLTAAEKMHLASQLEPIKTIPIHTMVEQFGAGFERIPGLYDRQNQAIYIAQHVYHDGGWILNNDVEFQLSHEVGHAVNATLKHDLISNLDTDFKTAFEADFAKLTASEIVKLNLKNKGHEHRMDEIFADLYAHAKGIPTNNARYSGEIVRLFEDTLKVMKQKNFLE